MTAAILIFAGVAEHDSHAVPTAPDILQYRVKHSKYGDIGSYSNRIERHGDETTVETSVHLKVSILGVVLHREDAERTERWRGNRLVYFHGITTKNGDKIEVDGEAKGDGFVIASPKGTVTAPADVHPANPWSGDCIHSDTMMRVDTGVVEPVRISGGQPTDVTLDNVKVQARLYDIEGETRYKVWLDDRSVPVRFSVDDPSGVVTFSLAP
jgi:hypothetical protein